MRLIKAIKNLINTWTDDTVYDSSKLVQAFNAVPASLDQYASAFLKQLLDETKQVYAAANTKEFTIGVVGNFSVGKSSFVNALIGEVVAPVASMPCTAIITKIKYGRNRKVVVQYVGGNSKVMSYQDYLRFSAFTLEDFRERERTGRVSRFDDIAYAIIYVPSEFLRINNLCLVDTLGLFAHQGDNEKTIAAIKDAIVIIYLFDERGVSELDAKFISRYLRLGKGDTFFCSNRIDLVKKAERGNLKDVLELKLNDIMSKNGNKDKFPRTHIFQVSSLFQNFACGLCTDDDKWREGVDYASLSGFNPLMDAISEYVKENAVSSRRNAVLTQLDMARQRVDQIASYCEDKAAQEQARRAEQIFLAKKEREALQKRIQQRQSVFELLEQQIQQLRMELFPQIRQAVERKWPYMLKFELMDKLDFDVSDFMSLKVSIFELQLNVFKSMDDKRYAELQILTPCVELVSNFIQQIQEPLVKEFSAKLKHILSHFSKTYRLQEAFSNPKVDFEDYGYSALHIAQSESVVQAMYRAVAKAATESVWVKNDTRKSLMLNAAKTESLKKMQHHFHQELSLLSVKWSEKQKLCYNLSIRDYVNRMALLQLSCDEWIKENRIIVRKKEQEQAFFLRMRQAIQESRNSISEKR